MATPRATFCSALLLLLVLLAGLHSSQAGCDVICPRKTTRTLACEANLVMKAKFNEEIDPIGRRRFPAYNMTIRQIFKADRRAESLHLEAGSSVLLMDEQSCHVSLVPGHVYVLTARVSERRLLFSRCDFAHSWKALPEPYKRAFRHEFYTSC